MTEVVQETSLADTNPNVEKLKLYKNTKGYNWDIQLIKEPAESWDKAMERLQEVNTKMIMSYGS